MFQCGELETMVCKFILLRMMHKNIYGGLDEFYEMEKQYRRLPELMQYLLASGGLYIFSSGKNPVNTVGNVFSGVFLISS